MVAAAKLGRFWPLLLKVYEQYDSFCPERLGTWAVEAGLARQEFEAAMTDSRIRQLLVESKREGLRNKVAETPALFVDGRRYLYDLAPESVVDVLEEAYEAARRSQR
jgi:hypothetical protein